MSDEKNYLMVFSAPVPGKEAAYESWYNDVHLPDVLSLPGFKAAQRFEFAVTHTPHEPPRPYMALYELDGSPDDGKRVLEAARTGGQLRMSDALDPASMAAWWVKPLTKRMTSE